MLPSFGGKKSSTNGVDARDHTKGFFNVSGNPQWM
jgi:hypothetical protein